MKECVLTEDKICNNCGECFKCDVDPSKICDNCGACIGLDADYRAIEVTEILWQQEGPETSKPALKPFKSPGKSLQRLRLTKKSSAEVYTLKSK